MIGPSVLRLFVLDTVALLLGQLAPSAARAELRIDITKGQIQPLPIAITDFASASPAEATIGSDLAQVISADLERSGLFKPIDQRAFIQTAESLQGAPRFADWRQINAQALVTGSAERQADGRLRVEFRLWDVYGEAQLTGMSYTTTPENWRHVAHIVADEIYKRLTGEDGYFASRIVYVAESGPLNKRVKRLAIMDQDGASVRYLSDGRSISITPRFSPTRQEITYMSYESGEPRVYLLQIETGQRELVGNFPGMTFAPRFSPDGQKVIMSLLRDDGNSNIFAMDLRSRSTTRLTNSTAIDTSPSYSPDGSKVVFTSDRGGRAQIYVMGADGSGQTRISFGDGVYSTPVWSPRGDLIAFTKQTGGEFQIGVMKTDGSGERILTSGFHNEGPTFSPNGRVLMFFRDPGGTSGPSLFTVDVSGRNEQRVPTPGFASDPAWSPLLS